MTKIDSESILNKTKKFSKSKRGQQKVKELREKAFDENRQFGTTKTGGIVRKEDFQRVASESLQAMLLAYAKDPESKWEGIATVQDIFNNESNISEVTKPRKSTYRVTVSFNKNALHRKSLINPKTGNRTGKGIRNIIALLNNGADILKTKKIPFGIWEAHGNTPIRALAHRKPIQFMQNGAKEFKSKYRKKYEIKSLEIGDAYKKK